MRHADLAALRWVEVTIRRIGRQAASRYSRYAHELTTDSEDVDAWWGHPHTAVNEDRDVAMDIRQAFRSLPKEERQVLFLSVVADWPQKRIAAAMHRSQARISQLRYQALEHMRDQLAEGKDQHD